MIAKYETDQGSIRVVRPRRGLLRSTVVGHIDTGILDVLMTTRDQEAIASPDDLHYFHDWTQATSYDTAVRIAATEYMLSLPKPYTHVHIVTSSRILNMGVATGSLAMQLAGRPLHAYISLPAFETAYENQVVRI